MSGAGAQAREGGRRVVAVTGGTQGIGLAIAERFHREGDAVAVCSRSPRPPSLPEGILHRRADVRRREELQWFLDAVRDAHGSLNVWVNCAGVSGWRPIEDVDEPFVEDILHTSLLGTLWGCSVAAAAFSNGGCIVNVSSLAGKRGSPNNSVYCAAKFAVNGMTQALAKELGPRGIRVNAVCPGYVETEGVLKVLAGPHSPATGQGIQTYLASFASTQTALRRLSTAEEIAAAVWFLASPEASAITGQCLNVDCGTLPQ